MQPANSISGITRQTSIISTASQTDCENNNQQRPQNGINHSNMSTRTATSAGVDGGSWRCEVFVDTPMTRELIQGPLNIQLPPIQLPSGLQNLVGQFTASSDEGAGNQQQYPLQRQTSMAIGDGVAAVSAFHHHQHNGQQQEAHQNPIAQQSPNSPPSIPADSANVQQNSKQQKPGEGNSGGQSSPASSLASNWGRASSTPAVMNLSGGSGGSVNTSSSFNNTGDSIVIEMDIGSQTGSQGTTSNARVHRRRSSSPVRSSSGHFVETIGSPSEPQLIQRTVANNQNNAGDRTLSTTTTAVPTDAEIVDITENHPTNNSADEEDATFRRLRARFQELLRRRHQILRNIVQQTGEFPSLYALGVLFSWLLVIIFVLIQFFAIEFTACLSLFFCIFHYSDVIAFKRYISGTGSGWLLTAKIVLRQFILLQVLGQSVFIFPAAIFQPVAVNSQLIANPTFWSTLYIVFITEYFIMDCLLCAKILVSNLPKCSTMYKRRLYQWLEYSAALYRFTVPFSQWNAYLNAMWWTVLYGGMKILLSLSMAWGWLLTTLRIFRATHLGTTPSEADCKKNEPCTICFGEFASPIKLKCAHIFCSECIRTWLDREHTCPICRAVVTKEDNNYRNGESMFPSLF